MKYVQRRQWNYSFIIIIANFDQIFKPFSKFLLRDNIYKNILKKLIRVKS